MVKGSSPAGNTVAYLSRYSHRIAISDTRILGLESDQVAFRYKDYRDHDRVKVMRLSGVEFVRRFLLHVLPKGFMRHHYGFLANRCRAKKLEQIRAMLVQGEASPAVSAEVTPETSVAGYPCPKCHQGRVRMVYPLAPLRWEGG